MAEKYFKLYRVTLRGCKDLQVSYVVAKTADMAYEKVRKLLDKKDYGFWIDREMQSIELIAECKDYPDCKTRLFL